MPTRPPGLSVGALRSGASGDWGVAGVTVVATPADGNTIEFPVNVRVDTPKEWEYYQNGGILHYVLRQLAA